MKPSIPKGTRDFSPTEVAKRTYIFNTIQSAFELYGFQPIETPSFENSSTLLGKYGEEGDRLIFKILNSGDYLKGLNKDFSNNLFKIRNKVFSSFASLKRYLDSKKELESVFSKDESLFLKAIKDFSYLKDEDIQLFNISKDYVLLKLSRIYFENDYGNENELVIRLISNFLQEVLDSHLRSVSNKVTAQISEKALRYDLTVPFARYVVQHQNDIVFPFKRYQMQPVWRADRPQKGRFREFYQCDADVVGSKSLFQEVEFIQLYDAIFTELGIATTIKLNNRKVLSGIAEIIGAQDKLIDFTVALDKLDKIGEEGVVKEMLAKGIAEDAIEKVTPLFNLNGTNTEQLSQLKGMLATSDEGTQGVEELQFVIDAVAKLGLKSANLAIDVTLARGLNYYTGAIFEVAANDVKLGSIGGGGRYDDLTGIFGLKDMSGIGISFGLDRIQLVLEDLGLFKSVELPKPKVLFINFGEQEALYCLTAIKNLRENGIKSELYPDAAKMKKQMTYANRRAIDFVVLAGESEIENNNYTLKNMNSGEQTTCNLEELVENTKNS